MVGTQLAEIDTPLYATEPTNTFAVNNPLVLGSSTDLNNYLGYTGAGDATYIVQIDRVAHSFDMKASTTVDLTVTAGVMDFEVDASTTDDTTTYVSNYGKAFKVGSDICWVNTDNKCYTLAGVLTTSIAEGDIAAVYPTVTFEPTSAGAATGTLTCVYPNCFANVKDNDRLDFWYMEEDSSSSSGDDDMVDLADATFAKVVAKLSDNKVKVMDMPITGDNAVVPEAKIVMTRYGRISANTWSWKKTTETECHIMGEIAAATDTIMIDGIYIKFPVASGYAETDKWYINARALVGGNYNADNANTAHQNIECGGRGLCDRKTGNCKCFAGWEGEACQRTVCPNECSGHGICQTLMRFASDAGMDYDGAWDSTKQMGCKCDAGFRGPDCSLMECPGGADPLLADFSNGVQTYFGRDCSGRGLCDYSTGVCQCFKGYFGERCENQVNCM
jgi:hypothetical protein